MGLTGAGRMFVLVVTTLSIAHHADHVLRGVTGWPLAGGFNPFSASLFVYPVIVVGVLRSVVGRVASRFWAFLAGGGAIFIVGAHVGPAAGDSVADISGQHGSSVAGVIAVAVLVAFFVVLVAHCLYEWRRGQ